MKWLLAVALALVMGTSHAAAPVPHGMPEEVVVNGVEFRWIPGGWTWYPVARRDPKNHYESLGRHEIKVWIDGFYIAKFEARARDFARFLNSGAAKFAAQYDYHREGQGGAGAQEGCGVRKNDAGAYYLVDPNADLPATHMSWQLANEFAGWLGARLPTEAEWVRAFRGDDKRIYPWGNDYPDDTFAGFQEGGTNCNVQPVTSFAKGRSPFGVYNMAGNVFEYVADWYNVHYLNGLTDGERNPFAATPLVLPESGVPLKRLRGGRWASSVAEISIYGNADTHPADNAFNCFGTRLALDVETVRLHLQAGSATISK